MRLRLVREVFEAESEIGVGGGTARRLRVAVAEGMCKFSPYGLQMTKQVIWANLENPSLQAAIELEDRNQLMLGMTDNLPEAIRSFDQEREPVYTDLPRRGL